MQAARPIPSLALRFSLMFAFCFQAQGLSVRSSREGACCSERCSCSPHSISFGSSCLSLAFAAILRCCSPDQKLVFQASCLSQLQVIILANCRGILLPHSLEFRRRAAAVMLAGKTSRLQYSVFSTCSQLWSHLTHLRLFTRLDCAHRVGPLRPVALAGPNIEGARQARAQAAAYIQDSG
jgi:hypothetical protein